MRKKEKNVSLVAKVSPSMKNQIFAIAEKRNETAATVMRELIRASLENLEKTA
jgi:predicted DNA-binding protein